MSYKRKYNQERAKILLVHYFKVLFNEIGIPFRYDNQVEIEEIIDNIFEEFEEDEK